MKINCIAIEDEPLALRKLEEFISQVEYLNLLGSFDNALKAIGFLKNKSIDLLFLDVRMKGITGIQLLESLKVKPKVIITSAYDEYALKGYELEVSDYLLKPYTFDRFLKSVDKIYNEFIIDSTRNKQDFIFVKTEYKIEKVSLSEICYIQGMKDYLQIVTTNKKVMTLQSFKNMEQALPQSEFVRVHNSYIVAVSKIESIERNRIQIFNTHIPISETYKSRFYSLLKEKQYLL